MYFMDTVTVFVVVYVRTLSVRCRIILLLMNWEGFGRNRSWPTRNAIHMYAWRKWERNVGLSLFGSIFEPGIYRKRSESCRPYHCCVQNDRFLGVLANMTKTTFTFVMSVWSHGTSRLQVDGFSWNFTFLDFSKICHGSSSFVKIWQE
jgi:hypothetical protein